MRPGAEEENRGRGEACSLGPDWRLALFQCNYGACVWERRVQERSSRDRREREREARREGGIEKERERGGGGKKIDPICGMMVN